MVVDFHSDYVRVSGVQLTECIDNGHYLGRYDAYWHRMDKVKPTTKTFLHLY